MANTDHYLPCGNYENLPADPNLAGFTKAYDGTYYIFSVVSASGAVLLRSETYPTELARDNGIDSVSRNRDIDARYSVVQDGEHWFVVLKAGNHQEIGRSCGFATEAEAQAHIAKCKSDYVEPRAVAEPAAMASSSRTTGIIEDYLPCEAYVGHAHSEAHEGFDVFSDGGSYYFALTSTSGKVLLRSEAYTTEAARNNGIESVLRNIDISARYSVIEENGSWYVVLKAGNNQEIARSCACKSEADARGLIVACGSSRSKSSSTATTTVTETLTAKTVEASPEVVGETKTIEKIEAAPVVIEAPVKISAIEEEKTVAPAVAVAAAATVVTAAVTRTPTELEDDYLPCAEYRNKTINDKPNNVALFKHENGQFYFVIYNADGSVRLRSEGFGDAKRRDDELSAVLKNINNKDLYKTVQSGKFTMNILYDKNGREVGRSCLESPAKPEKEDDYLPCKEYSGHPVTDKVNNIALFTAADGQFYFVAYNADGSVRLRSEGFGNTKDRDSELAGLIKNLNNESKYKTLENGAYFMRVLYDESGREVGRSCLEKRPEPVPVAIPVVETVAAAVAVAAVAPIVEEIVVKKEEPKVVEKPKVVETPKVVEPEKTVVYTKPVQEAAYVAPVVEEAVASGGFKWWYLLPLLLLIPLFWNKCGGCKKEVPPVKTEIPAPPAPVQEPAPAPAAPTCSCTGNAFELFNIDATKAPKTLTKLGTSPEFGSLHGLTANEVYERMSRWHKKYASSRKFLDNCFTAMGYTNGFADAKPEMFSEALVASGTTGNMGYGGDKHKTIYATLSPVSDRDLQAFRIKSANGCDLHFMKTCGNHFYYCPK
jgi:uncharacterized protein YegP (UPF0339 family)